MELVTWQDKRRMLNFVVCIVSLLMLLKCTVNVHEYELSQTPVSAEIMWTVGGVEINPVAVDYVRITITSDCGNSPPSKTRPFNSPEGFTTSVKTGCTFDLLFEGLGMDGQSLYIGEKKGVYAGDSPVNLRITAQGCTPAPPDSLKASPAGRRIRISWHDRSNNETGFIIKRTLGANPSITLDTVTTGSYLDTFNIKRSPMLYQYEVYSYNSIGNSIKPAELTYSLPPNISPYFTSEKTDMDSIAEVDSIYCDTMRYNDDNIGDSLYMHVLYDISIDTSINGSIDTSSAGVVLKDSIITWTPSFDQKGKCFTIAVILSDQDSWSDTLIWSVCVNDTVISNLPPVFQTDSLDLNGGLFIGEQYLDTLKAIDPELGTVLYSVLKGPDNLSIESTSGIITWNVDRLGQIPVSAIAKDITEQKDTVTWTITVSDTVH